MRFGWVLAAVLVSGCGADPDEARAALMARDRERSSPTGVTRELSPARAALSRAGDTGYTAGTYRSVGDGVTETGKYVAVWNKTDNDAWAVVEELFHADVVETPEAPRVFLPASQMGWTDAPYDLPPGAKATILGGDLSRPGPFVIRLQLHTGYRIPPHWYQGDINLTVISGILGVGLGETWDNAALQPLMTGGFLSFPAGTRHFLVAEAPTLLQLQGAGPLAIHYAR
jgi:hypothetical protein